MTTVPMVTDAEISNFQESEWVDVNTIWRLMLEMVRISGIMDTVPE